VVLKSIHLAERLALRVQCLAVLLQAVRIVLLFADLLIKCLDIGAHVIFHRMGTVIDRLHLRPVGGFRIQ